ncbi:MAG TPA: NlpC/P60 family protein [Candidatus Paceibacterota bacterium]
MNVPGKRTVTLVLIVASGLTAVTASQAKAQPQEKLTIVSATYAPSTFLDTNRGTMYLPSHVDSRASRSAFRRETIKVAEAPAPQLSKVDIVIAFALAQRGKPYIWAAAGPRGYDCSGLVLASFARVGIHLPHFTGTMLHYGRYVSRSQLMPGDIIFPSSSHVGIYIGHGKMIVAPHSGSVVQIQSVYAFYMARRLL